MNGHLKVLRAGRGETIQDGGRRGYMRYGVTSSGPMDWVAYATANRALGNEPGAAAIEVSIYGIDLRCEVAPLRIAYAGGDFVFTYNQKRQLPNAGGLPESGGRCLGRGRGVGSLDLRRYPRRPRCAAGAE